MSDPPTPAVARVFRALAVVRPSYGPDPDAAWREPLATLDQALERDDLIAAMRAWREAYGAALGSGSWESMLATGDAAVRLAQALGTPGNEAARDAYRIALFRARRMGAADGVSRAGEALERLSRATDPGSG